MASRWLVAFDGVFGDDLFGPGSCAFVGGPGAWPVEDEAFGFDFDVVVGCDSGGVSTGGVGVSDEAHGFSYRMAGTPDEWHIP